MNRVLQFNLAVLCVVPVARAHDGPRIWIGNLCGQIVTFAGDDDLAPTRYPPSRLFETELTPFFGVFSTQFPGFEVRQTDGNVPSSTTFGFEIAGPALYFDEASGTFLSTTERFGAPQAGPVPQLAISQGSNIRTTAGGYVPGFAFFTYYQTGDHAHLAFTLLGDGTNPVDGAIGIYGLSLRLTGGGLETGDTFFLLLRKGIASNDPVALEARAAAERELAVPADLDGDLDVDLYEAAALQVCFTGSGGGPLPCNCVLLDLDGDGDMDAADTAEVVSRITGPGALGALVNGAIP